MRPEAIRELNEEVQKGLLKTKHPAAHDAGMMSLQVSILAELAAQVAEANEHLVRIANPEVYTKDAVASPFEYQGCAKDAAELLRECRRILGHVVNPTPEEVNDLLGNINTLLGPETNSTEGIDGSGKR